MPQGRRGGGQIADIGVFHVDAGLERHASHHLRRRVDHEGRGLLGASGAGYGELIRNEPGQRGFNQGRTMPASF